MKKKKKKKKKKKVKILEEVFFQKLLVLDFEYSLKYIYRVSKKHS